MALAISSYEQLSVLSDRDGVLNLAWTLDEREHLAVDLTAVVARELATEIRDELPFVSRYFVQDPYGEGVLGPAVARFFSRDGWDLGVTCGAGVNSLLHALARLAESKPVCVIGDVYPDFLHWIDQSGRGYVTRDEVRRSGARLIFLERPALIGDDIELDRLRELCDEVAPLDVLVIVDESYGNYYPPSYSAVNIAPEVHNLAVLRGLSKAYWQGGLRLGYCVSSAAITRRIRSVIAPMLASSLSLKIGRTILDLGDITAPLRERVVAARAEMLSMLTGFQHSAEFVPYIFGSDSRDLERRGIVGKLQPFWIETTRSLGYRYRLSVPLAAPRMAVLRAKLGGDR